MVNLFCSLFLSQNTCAIDELSVLWQNINAYAFSPINLLAKVHVQQRSIASRL